MAEIVLLEERGIPISYIDGIGLYGLIVTGDLLPLQLESGKTYTVVWNGTRHTRTASEMSVMGMTVVAVGNADIVGGEADPENLDFFLFTVPADGRVGVLTPTESATATVGLYEVIEEESIILKNPQGNDAKYPMKQMIRLNTTKGTKIYSKGEAIENVAVTLDLTSGDQTINAPDGYLVKSAVIKKPEDAQPENILKNKNIGGIVGELEMPEKITATIDPDFSEGDMVVTPDAGKVFSGVTVIKPANLVPENIAKNEVVAGVVGTHEGGGSDNASESEFIYFSGSSWLSNKSSTAMSMSISITVEPEYTDVKTAIRGTMSNSTSLKAPGLYSSNGMNPSVERYFELAVKEYTNGRKTYTYSGKFSPNASNYVIWTVTMILTCKIPGYIVKKTGENLTLFALENAKLSLISPGFQPTADVKIVDLSAIQNAVDITQSHFAGWTDIEKVIMPPNINSNSSSLFSGCYKLNTVVFPGDVITVDIHWFSVNSATNAISNVIFEGNVDSIADYAFCQNALAGSIVLDLSKCTKVPTISAMAFGYSVGAITTVPEIRVPSALYDSWITQSNWPYFVNYIVAV